jgi:acyl-CoA thioesterase
LARGLETEDLEDLMAAMTRGKFYGFDAATGVARTGEGRWSGEVQDGWDFAGLPNGGYLMAVAVQAMVGELSRNDPIVVSAHFLSPASAGPAEISVSKLREGRRHASATASLRQGETEIAYLLGTFGDLRGAGHSSEYLRAEPPALPPPDECESPRPLAGFEPPPITQKVELRLLPEHAGFAHGNPPGIAEVAGWARFADGRPVDTLSLPLFADAMPPAVFNAGLPLGWVPTIELTVQIRKRPAPGWLRCRFTTRLVAGGYLEEDGEIWDSEDDLVALSRQLALAHTRQPGQDSS